MLIESSYPLDGENNTRAALWRAKQGVVRWFINQRRRHKYHTHSVSIAETLQLSGSTGLHQIDVALSAQCSERLRRA